MARNTPQNRGANVHFMIKHSIGRHEQDFQIKNRDAPSPLLFSIIPGLKPVQKYKGKKFTLNKKVLKTVMTQTRWFKR